VLGQREIHEFGHQYFLDSSYFEITSLLGDIITTHSQTKQVSPKLYDPYA